MKKNKRKDRNKESNKNNQAYEWAVFLFQFITLSCLIGYIIKPDNEISLIGLCIAGIVYSFSLIKRSGRFNIK